MTQIAHTKTRTCLQGDREEPFWFVINPSSINLVCLGFNDLAADLLWLQLVQYIGDTRGRLRDGSVLAQPMLESIVAADPHYTQVYWFAAFLIGGDQKRPEVADKIIRKGIEANPNDWSLPFIAGVNQYLYSNQEQSAARYYRMASKFPGAPKWLSRQALVLEGQIPTAAKKAHTWQSVYEAAKTPEVKWLAHSKLCEIWLDVWRRAPTALIKQNAQNELNKLGVVFINSRNNQN